MSLWSRSLHRIPIHDSKSIYRLGFVRCKRGVSILRHLQLFRDIITEDEEQTLMLWIDPIMKRKRYEGK